MTQSKTSRRKNLRLPGYDYSQPGFYCVTICTKNRRCLLASIYESKVKLSDIGSIVEANWLALPDWFPNVALDQFVVMPNHLHGILEVRRQGHSIGNVIGSFKSATTRLCYQNYQPADRELWQRGYFDRIIRSEKALLGMRLYILDNPTQWHQDELNPELLLDRATHGVSPTVIDFGVS